MTRGTSIRAVSSFGLVLALAGCNPSVPPVTSDAGGRNDAFVTMPDSAMLPDGISPSMDAGVDAAMVDVDAFVVDVDAAPEVDAHLAPDTGLTATWDRCAEAVVFGSDGEACSFTGSCIECVLTPAPRQALCMSGRLRVTAAGAGACSSTPDGGIVLPDTGPRLDGGPGSDAAVCGPVAFGFPEVPACSMTVVNCIRAGGSLSTCVSAEAACLTCVQQDLQACATQSGECSDAAGLALCCFDEHCPDFSCTTTTCATQWNAYRNCVQGSECTVSDACFPAPPACPPLAWAAPTTVSCTAATATCFADPDTTLEECLAGDTPACGECVNDGLISCVTDTGACTSELGNVQCCIDSACPSGDATCVNAALSAGGTCEALWDGFFTCVNTALPGLPAGSCSIDACFP